MIAMKVEPTEVELAEQAAESARATHATWSTARQEQEAKGRAIADELATNAAKLTELRRSALSGRDDPAAVAELLAAKRVLEDEAEEVASRVALAKGEEAAAHAVYGEASLILDAARVHQMAVELAERATALDAQIDEAIGVLYALLADRWEIEQTGSRGAGLPRLPLRLDVLSHIRDNHGRYPGLGGG
jgi:hypothetical protein